MGKRWAELRRHAQFKARSKIIEDSCGIRTPSRVSTVALRCKDHALRLNIRDCAQTRQTFCGRRLSTEKSGTKNRDQTAGHNNAIGMVSFRRVVYRRIHRRLLL